MTEEKVHETGRGKIRIEIELSLNGQKTQYRPELLHGE